MQPTTTLLLGLLLAYLIRTLLQRLTLALSRSKFRKSHACLPPRRYPHRDPLLGLDYFLRSTKAFAAKRLIAQHESDFSLLGPTFLVNNTGSDRIVTKDPQNIRAVLKSPLDEWGVEPLRRLSLEPVGGPKNFFIRDDVALWKMSREHIKPALVRAEFSNLEVLEGYVERFLELCPRDGETVDVGVLFDRLVQDYMSSYIFGRSIDSMTLTPTRDQKQLSMAFKTASTAVVRRTQTEAALGKTILKLLPKSKEFVDACNTVDDFINGCIEKAAELAAKKDTEKSDKAQTDGRFTLVNQLYASTQDEEYLRGILTTLYTGATDSTATLLSNIVFHLSRNPNILITLRQELAPLGTHLPEFKEIQKLQYLRAVINESLRLHPIAPLTARVALRDTTLPSGGGPDGTSPIFVAKGTVVSVLLGSVMSDTTLWSDDAGVFRPERWLEKEFSPRPWSYVPFGGGERTCPDQQFALATVAYVMVRFLQVFKGIESRDDREYVPWLRLTTSNFNGYAVGLVPV